MKKIIYYNLIILLLTTASYANITISGSVTDVKSGKPLFGANVILLDTDMGAATDIDGQYTIADLPLG